MKKSLLLATAFAAAVCFSFPVLAESTLAQIKKTGTVKFGYRESSIPFSFVGDNKKPRGYSIDLCTAVAEGLAQQLKIKQLTVRWVPVSAQSRFTALKSGQIDLECGNTTQTLSRRADFDFSLMTFVDGAGLLFRKGEMPKSQEELSGQRVVVVAGTTTEKVLEERIAVLKLESTLIKVADHDSAMKALSDKVATAYAADRTVLITTALVRGQGKDFDLAEIQFTFEPYGLMMRRDADFRLAVDRTIANLYRSGEISSILQRWFEPLGKPVDALRVMFLLNGLPE